MNGIPQQNKNPIDGITKLFHDIENFQIDAMFMDENRKKAITRAFIEMNIEDICLWTQNQTLFNKFLQIDTKLEKALREYQAEIKTLLSGIVNTQYMQAPAPTQQVVPTPMTQTPVVNPQELQPVPPSSTKPQNYASSIGIS